ncbi:oxygen-independent coproporphyrinogen III oxidase [Litoreibacter janthinus]|uniref:Coproporphyrinogen-III oxidase n=1 Tax=Litoreibacter janthinus TaxID=670154 RepID=A0A1I6FR33_9RHOB|nr:oxygen-independent coproporphyrinogen III oxidase [Litoreibacter janthinus]SFR32257.1 oxygen-independent coproporphyrinogen-3 oxidase [Litoreibacter janthinus]
MTQHETLRRYGLFTSRAPRYTSYPTAPHFNKEIGPETMADWLEQVDENAKVSLYVHIPFCRRLCWFCACRTQGTQTDAPLRGYLDMLKAELAMIANSLPTGVKLGRLHWGGGTPTILPPAMIRELAAEIDRYFPLSEGSEFSVEIDPTLIDADKIAALSEAGLTRASLGIQDFDPHVQSAIGRIQSFDETKWAAQALREAGAKNLNLDILYGLPFQTADSLTDTVAKTLDLSPDRLALYGYAHVPWAAKRQVLIPEDHLPDGPTRYALFHMASQLFGAAGYDAVGIDHFARAGDGLLNASLNGTLRRNFQGYTDDQSEVLIGVGASSISRFPNGYAQNAPGTGEYATAIASGKLATTRGHAMSADDTLRAQLIEDLMCRFAIDFKDVAQTTGAEIDEVVNFAKDLHKSYADVSTITAQSLSLSEPALSRLMAMDLDAYQTASNRHSLAI